MTAVYFGVGAGVGSMVGGFLLDAKMSWPATWTACAAFVALGWGVSASVGVLIGEGPVRAAALGRKVQHAKRQLYRGD